MGYRIVETEEMNRLLDNIIVYLIFSLNNSQAASHLISSLEKIYIHLEENPYIYRESDDEYLQSMHYHEAVISDMNYILVYRVEGKVVYVLGIFHGLENYQNKVK